MLVLLPPLISYSPLKGYLTICLRPRFLTRLKDWVLKSIETAFISGRKYRKIINSMRFSRTAAPSGHTMNYGGEVWQRHTHPERRSQVSLTLSSPHTIPITSMNTGFMLIYIKKNSGVIKDFQGYKCVLSRTTLFVRNPINIYLEEDKSLK